MHVLKQIDKVAVISLLKSGCSQREIEQKTRINRKTIRRYARMIEKNPDSVEALLLSKSPPRPPDGNALKSTSNVAKSACEPHRKWIEEQIRLGRNAVSIYQDLVERFGFENAYNSVKKFVRRLRKTDPEQYDRLEFAPGEESQVDYGQGALTRHPKTGKYCRPRLFVMTLKYSRRAFRKAIWKSSKIAWAKLHEEAFRYFGGCTKYVVLDNLKEGILKADIYEPELNPLYAAMLKHLDVIADPARVADPDRKGTVENAIKHTQSTALKGRKFETIEEQNEWLMHWEEHWAAPRIHGRAKRQVEEMFQEERPHLKIMPLLPFRYFEQGIRTVQDDGCIQVGSSFYSALPAAIYSEVTIRIYDLEIEIRDRVTLALIRSHQRSHRPGSVAMEEKDRIFNPSNQTRTILKQADLIGTKTRELCQALFDEEGRPGQRKLRGIISLAKKYHALDIENACALAMERGIHSYQVVKKLVQQSTKKNLNQFALKN